MCGGARRRSTLCLTFLLRWNLGFRGKLVLLITPTLDINPWCRCPVASKSCQLSHVCALCVANARDSTRDPTSSPQKNQKNDLDVDGEEKPVRPWGQKRLVKPTTKPCLMNKRRIVQCGHIVFSEIANERKESRKVSVSKFNCPHLH